MRAERLAQRKVKQIVARAQAARAPKPAAVHGPALEPGQALSENGFTVFQGLFTPDECRAYAAALKSEAGIQDGTKFTKVDATNCFPTAREVLFEGRIVDAVRTALGAQPRFLQIGDLHYLHDTAGWHRDSVHRALDSSQAPDWREGSARFGVVKAILYLESANAAMGIMAGSHASPLAMDIDRVRGVEGAGRQLVVDLGENPNVALSAEQKRSPLAWHAQAGDVLVFDERMYHAGRRVDNGKVTTNREAAKFTLSLVFGIDNEHSERMYSYFRFVRRDLPYRDLPADFVAELESRELVLDRGWTDFYRDHPDDLRHAHLPDPARLEPLLAEYLGTVP